MLEKETHPTGRGRESVPPNSPSLMRSTTVPNSMLHSLTRLSVQKGRRKSWWSMCGGIQSPSSYMLIMQLSGTHVGGKTCHLTSRLIVVRKRGGMGSTTSSRKIPGGFPSLSCKSKHPNRRTINSHLKEKHQKLIVHCLIANTSKVALKRSQLNRNPWSLNNNLNQC